MADLPRAPDAPSRPAEKLADATAGVGSSVAFGALSAFRRRRIFHPHGLAFEATFDAPGGRDFGAPLLDDEGRHRAVVRISRGAGLPESLPDVLGLALRVLDAHGPGAHQDLLLATTGGPPVLRHLLVPSPSYAWARYSTLLPHRIGGRLFLLGARPLLSEGTKPPRHFDELARAVQSAKLRFQIEVAPLVGGWQPVATLEIGPRLPDDETEALRFNPFVTGGGIEPAGVLQALRRRAYTGSQAARPLPDGRPPS